MTGERLTSWWVRHPLVVDTGLAVLLVPVTAGGSLASVRAHADLPLAIVWWLLFFVPVALRRKAPDVGIALLVVALLVQLVVLQEPSPADVVVPISLYAIGRYGRPRLQRWWFGAGLLGSLAAGVQWGTVSTAPDHLVPVALNTVFCAAVVTASYVLGSSARQRRATLDALHERAEALEREREQGRTLAAQEERARIARDMHDVVAHSLSVVVVQADGASYLAAQRGADPAIAAALAAIGDTARSALAETRRLVGVLREPGENVELAPSATLAQIEELTRHTGLPTTFAQVGESVPLSTAGEQALYRVAQESLTNVLKHAGPAATIDVLLEHRADEVALAVRNTGLTATSGDGAGHGVIGMQERMAAVGGTLVARPRLGGGFEVVATCPRT